MIIPNVHGMNLDPLAQAKMGSPTNLGVYDEYNELPLNCCAFMGVDCTKPFGIELKERASKKLEIEKRIGEIWKTIQL